MHCATAGDTEQNGFKRFKAARRAFITCFRRVMIFRWQGFQGKRQNRNASCVKQSALVFFVARKARYDFEFSLANASKSTVTRLNHVTNAPRATGKCQISLSHKPRVLQVAISHGAALNTGVRRRHGDFFRIDFPQKSHFGATAGKNRENVLHPRTV